MAEGIGLCTILPEGIGWNRCVKLAEQVEESFSRLPVALQWYVWDQTEFGADADLQDWAEQRGGQVHHLGANVYRSQAWRNLATLATEEKLICFDAVHGSVNDPTWSEDLLAASGAAAGCLHWVNYEVLGLPAAELNRMLWLTLDAGVFRIERKLLAEWQPHPFFPEAYADAWLSYSLQKAGYELADVATIKSVGAGKLKHPERFKYVHDYR